MPPFLLAALPFIIREVGPIIMREVVNRVGSDNPENVKRVTEQVSAELAANPPAAVKEAAAQVAAPKPWYYSKGVWGGAVTVAIGCATMAGVSTEWVDPEEATMMLVGAATAVSGIVSLVGRWKARKPIGT